MRKPSVLALFGGPRKQSPEPPPAAKPREGAKTHYVMVPTAPVVTGATLTQGHEFVACTEEEALRYANGDPGWKGATGQTSWTSRLWRRLAGP